MGSVWRNSLWGDASGGYLQVNAYADLPVASTVSGEIYVVLTGTGVWPFTYHAPGMYYSNGSAWSYMDAYPDTFKDGNFGIQNSADGTRVAVFNAAGISAGVTRTFAFPDASGTLALASGAGIDHGGLSGLADDDHTQYFLLVGRAGGQTIIGGTLTTETLSLRGNAADLTTGQVNCIGTKDASSTTVAAVTVAGGLGVAKKAYFGDAVDVGASTGAVLTIRRNDTSVTAGDSLGKIQFASNDVSTTTNPIAADIECVANNSITTDINPGRLIFRTTSTTVAATPTERMRITHTGLVGIATDAPLGTLDVSSGLLSIIMGADVSVTTRTDTTNKYGRLGSVHYTNAEEPLAIMNAVSTVDTGWLQFGGGAANMNTATKLSFYTAANNTTVTGTERMTIDSTGVVNVVGAISGTTETLSTAIADNTATTQVATTAFAKGQDAVLRRHPTQAVNLTYASSAATGIAIADNDNIDVGTTDFTLAWVGSLPDWTPLVTTYIMSKQDSANGYILSVLTTGALRLSMYRPTGTAYTTTALLGFIDGTSHSITALVTRETASIDGSIAFYVDGVLFETVAIDHTVADAGATLSSTDIMYVCGYSTKRYVSTVSFVAVYNRLLTGVQVLDMYRNGITYSDKWGSTTATYTSDFSVDVNGWIATRGTVAGNIDSIGGENDWLRFTITDTTSNTHHARLANALLQNKKYRLSLKYYIPSGQTNAYGFAVFEGSVALTTPWIQSPLMTVQDTVTSVSFEFETLPSSTWNGILYIAPYVGTSTTFQDAGGDDVAFYLKEIVLTEIGATLALQPEGINSFNWLDSSTNLLNATYPTAGSSLTRPAQGLITLQSGYNGLGTDSPDDVLDLGSAAVGRCLTWAGTRNIGTEYSGGKLFIGNHLKLSKDTSARILLASTNAQRTCIEMGGNATGDIAFATRAADGTVEDVFDITANTKMIILNSGFVGIGTNAPASLLEVQGGLTTTGSILTLGTKEPTVVVNDILGRINFYAPLEADGSDAILPGASIAAIAEDTFSTTVNKTSLLFQTGASETATTKVKITSGGYTALGVDSSAPAVKMKKLTGTTNAAEGGATSVAHGLTLAKILTFNVLVTMASGNLLQREDQSSAGYQFHSYADATNIVVTNHATNSENILSKGFTVLITYEE